MASQGVAADVVIAQAARPAEFEDNLEHGPLRILNKGV